MTEDCSSEITNRELLRQDSPDPLLSETLSHSKSSIPGRHGGEGQVSVPPLCPRIPTQQGFFSSESSIFLVSQNFFL